MADEDVNAEHLALFGPDTGDFVDLVLSDREGLRFRDNQSWQHFQPADMSLDGAEVVDVDPSFVDLFDRKYAAGARPSRQDALAHAAAEEGSQE